MNYHHLSPGKLLNVLPFSTKTPVTPVLPERPELLGLKWTPGLTMHQAKELSPYEVGDRRWRASVKQLASGKTAMDNFTIGRSTASETLDCCITTFRNRFLVLQMAGGCSSSVSRALDSWQGGRGLDPCSRCPLPTGWVGISIM